MLEQAVRVANENVHLTAELPDSPVIVGHYRRKLPPVSKNWATVHKRFSNPLPPNHVTAQLVFFQKAVN